MQGTVIEHLLKPDLAVSWQRASGVGEQSLTRSEPVQVMSKAERVSP